jgi:hypothetical protein
MRSHRLYLHRDEVFKKLLTIRVALWIDRFRYRHLLILAMVSLASTSQLQQLMRKNSRGKQPKSYNARYRDFRMYRTLPSWTTFMSHNAEALYECGWSNKWGVYDWAQLRKQSFYLLNWLGHWSETNAGGLPFMVSLGCSVPHMLRLFAFRLFSRSSRWLGKLIRYSK